MLRKKKESDKQVKRDKELVALKSKDPKKARTERLGNGRGN